MKRFLLLAFCCISAVCLAAQNLWPDPGFEESGEICPGAHSGQCAFVLKGGQTNRWFPSRTYNLEVEPFALYRATAWTKRDKNAGNQVYSLFFYSWDSFGWSFMFNRGIPEGDGWTKVSVNFYTPAKTVQFHPVAFDKCVTNARLFLDDLEIVRILSPEEHLEKLKKGNLQDRNTADALARYYLEKKDYAALADLQSKVTDWNKADIACLLAKTPEKAADRNKNVSDMIRFAGLNTPEGRRRLTEFFTEMKQQDAIACCLNAIPGGNPESVRKAFEQLLAQDAFGDGRIRTVKRKSLYANVIKALTDAKVPAYQGILDKAKTAMGAITVEPGNRNIVLGTSRLNAQNYAVVLPENPTDTEFMAADELVSFLMDITGQELPILSEKDKLPAHVILLGRNARLAQYGFSVDYQPLGLEGIHLECKNGNLLLAGGKRGVLYAVYTFLEDYLGCHWFTADCSVIPNHGSAKLGDFQHVFVPALEYRDTDYPCCRPPQFGVRNKLNGLYSTAGKLWGGHNTYNGFVHTMYIYVPPQLYAKEHPEYYALRNGKRMIEHAQPCLSNPEVIAIAKKRLRERIAAHPEHTLISVSQNDNQNFCQCPNCMAIAEKEGSQAGPLLYFVNELARDIAKDYPDKIIDTLAYQYTRKPPKFVKPEPNVCVRLCSIECCFTHPIEEDPTNASFIRDMQGWNKVCNRLHIWDYVINYRHSVMPFPNFRVLKPNIEFFLANGATGVYEEANYYSKGGELSELRSYVMSKLLWDATYDVNRAIFDFTEAYYGPAGKYIREYLKYLHDTVSGNKEVHMRIFHNPDVYLNAPGLMPTCEQFFRKAEAAVAHDPVLLHRVNVAHLPVIYATQELGTQLYRREGTKLTRKSAKQDDLTFFAAVAAKEGITQLCESRTSNVKAWVDSRVGAPAELEIVSLASDKTRIDILPALGGRLWKAVDLATGEDILQYFGSDTNGYVPTTSAYEEYASPGYRTEGWATKYDIVEKDASHIVLKARMSDGLIATRRIELLNGQSGFKVDTQYTADKDMPARSCRLHPQFHVEHPKQAKYYARKDDGSMAELDMSGYRKSSDEWGEIWLRGNSRPNGEWRVVYPCKHGTATLTNLFDAKNLQDCYIHCSELEQRVNLEQWTVKTPVTKTSGPHFTNTYIFSIQK